MSKTTFISEIQGLRAVAVIAVVLFHLQIPYAQGGFVGVDIFFVISGFVITLILKKEITEGSFSFGAFYMRRFWRIFPALSATILITCFLFLPFLPSTVDSGFFYSILTSIFGVANVYYFFSLDYFSSGTVNPLLHIWSLGVEEQFYLVFPFLLVAAAHFNKSIVTILFCFLAISFVSSSIVTELNQNAAFYLPWYRAWEFIIGALVAWKNVRCPSLRLASACSWLGFTLIASTIVFYNKQLTFPGVGALLPVIGTVLLLVSTHSTAIINRLLSTRSMGFIGNISYSVYLLHWPIICFIGMFLPLQNIYVRLMVIAASFIGGVLLHISIERPLLNFYKSTKLSGRKASISMLTPSLVAVCAITVFSFNLLINSFWSKHPQALSYITTKNTPELFRLNECFFAREKTDISLSYISCLVMEKDKPNILVTGDSLSANITSGLMSALPQFNFIQASAVNYKPGKPQKWSDMAHLLDSLVEEKVWRAEVVPDLVIYFAMWEDDDLDGLSQQIQVIKEYGSKVIVVGPPVDYYTNVPLLQGISEVTQLDLVPMVRRKSRVQMDQQFELALTDIADVYVSPRHEFCTDTHCMHNTENKSLYTDKVHLTHAGVTLLLSGLEEAIDGLEI